MSARAGGGCGCVGGCFALDICFACLFLPKRPTGSMPHAAAAPVRTYLCGQEVRDGTAKVSFFPRGVYACSLARRTTRKKHFPASPQWHFPAFPIFLNTGGESLSFGRSGSMGKVGHTKMPYCLPALSVRLLLLYSCR